MTREGYHQTSILQLEGYVPQVTMKYCNLILQLLGSNTGWGWEYGWGWDFRMLMFMQMSLANNIYYGHCMVPLFKQRQYSL